MIKCKLLSYSEQTAHLYPLAKSRAEATISELPAGIPSFKKVWRVGDVDITIKGVKNDPDWIVSVFLSGGSFEYIAHGTLHRLCRCRPLFVTRRELDKKNDVLIYDQITHEIQYLVQDHSFERDGHGNEENFADLNWSGGGYIDLFTHQGYGSGSADYDPVYSSSINFSVPADVCRPPKPDGYPRNNEHTFQATVLSESYSSWGGPPNPNTGIASGGSNRQVTVRLDFSDGTYQIVVGSEITSRQSISTPWLTGSTLSISYSNFPATYVAPVPPDNQMALSVLNGSFQTSNGTPYGNSSSNSVTTTYIYNRLPSGPDPRSVDWGAGRRESIERARAFAKACGDSAISLMDSGIMPPQHTATLKSIHPTSADTYANVYMKVRAKIDAPVFDTVGGKQRRIERSQTTLSFVDANGIARSETFIGFRQYIRTEHVSGSATVYSFEWTFDKWFHLDTDNVEVDFLHHVNYQEDRPFIPDILNNTISVPFDMSYVNGVRIQSGIAIADGGAFVPPLPLSTQLAPTYPSIVEEYMELFKPLYARTPSQPTIDIRFSDEELVTIVPFFFNHPIHGDLGHMPLGLGNDADDDYIECNSLSYDRAYVARFTTADGMLRIIEKKVWAKARTFSLPILTDFSQPNQSTGQTPIRMNSLFIFSGSKYADLTDAASEQTKRLKNPPEDEPLKPVELLYKQVISDLKSAA